MMLTATVMRTDAVSDRRTYAVVMMMCGHDRHTAYTRPGLKILNACAGAGKHPEAQEHMRGASLPAAAPWRVLICVAHQPSSSSAVQLPL